MGRLPLVNPRDAGTSSLAREAPAAAWAAQGRSVDPNVYRALAGHPRALRKLVEFGTVVYFDNSMTPAGAGLPWLGMPQLSYTATRGWSEGAMRAAVDGLEARGWLRDDALTDAGRAARAEIEDRTDAAEQAIVAALGGRLDAVCARLDGWSERCITAGAFPADILKRAAG